MWSDCTNETRIDSVDYSIVHLKRKRPFIIASSESRVVTNILVRIGSGDHHGIGVIAPNHVTGDTRGSAIDFLHRVVPILLGKEIGIEGLHDMMDTISTGGPASKCGLDCAFHDLLGQMLNRSLYRLLGARREAIKTSVTIGICGRDELLKRAGRMVSSGFDSIKLKTGLDMERDIEAVRTVRDHFPRVEIRVDCNQGYSVEGAIRFCDAIEHLDVSLIEQPVPARDLEGLSSVARRTSIPIMADESVSSLEDLRELSVSEAVSLVNIKLAKSGGIFPASLIAEACHDLSIGVMVGCMSECQASIAAGLHFALSQEAVAMADLDSHLSFVDDPTRAVECRDGLLWPVEGPGLGISISDHQPGDRPEGLEWKGIR
jgi:L-alanine-DL-glutamate epimerase-like enolase superfamily enzyme